MTCFLWHKWGKWEQYILHKKLYVFATTEKLDKYEERQQRTCLKCGKMQDAKVYKPY